MSVRLRVVLVLAVAGAAAWPSAAAARTVRVGVATLTVPDDWRSAGPRDATAAVFALRPGSPDRAFIAVAPATDRSLVPARLRPLAGDGGPRDVRLAGYGAWRYAGPAVDVTVLPSGAGVLGIACEAPVSRRSACAEGVTKVALGNAAVLAPAPDLAFRLQLPVVLARLDRARVDGRLALQRAGSAAAQAQASRGLAEAHRQAAQDLAALAGPAGRPLVAALNAAADGYLVPPGTASRGAVTRAESRLAAAIHDVVRADPPRAAPHRPAAPEAGRGPSVPLLLAALAAMLAGALWLLRRRAVSSPQPTGDAAPAPPRPIWVPRSAPPPVRWDAPRPGPERG